MIFAVYCSATSDVGMQCKSKFKPPNGLIKQWDILCLFTRLSYILYLQFLFTVYQRAWLELACQPHGCFAHINLWGKCLITLKIRSIRFRQSTTVFPYNRSKFICRSINGYIVHQFCRNKTVPKKNHIAEKYGDLYIWPQFFTRGNCLLLNYRKI